VVALKPLHDKARIKRVVVSTYQSVSGAARRPWTSCSLRPRRCSRSARSRAGKFPKRIAFNVIPQIDVFMEDGYTGRVKMMAETKKILDPKIKLTATCVRVPVFIGHAESVWRC